MPRLLIVGYGNPLRSDDGFGCHVAQRLRGELAGDVEVIAAQQLTPEIAEVASHAERVLFLDASHGGTPGSLNCQLIAPAESPSRHSHELSPAVVLGLSKELYGRCPTAHLLTVAAESFEAGETMTPTVAEAIPAVMAQVQRFIDGDL